MTAGCGFISVRLPPGDPFCLIARVVACPKAPALFWPGQNWPVLDVVMLAPVVSGERLTGRAPTYWLALGGQSLLVIRLPTAVHDLPAFAPVVHVPLTHFGHGEATLPVTCTREESGSDRTASPVVEFTVPLPFVWMTL